MPIYEFECSKCNKKIEKIISINDNKKKVYCCNIEARKVISIPYIKTGFHPFRSQCTDEHNKHIYFDTQTKMEEYHKKNDLLLER